jgi:hypothetical protein
VNDPAICRAAIRALAVYADEQTPAVLLKRYADLKLDEKQDVIATLAGRKSYALALLDRNCRRARDVAVSRIAVTSKYSISLSEMQFQEPPCKRQQPNRFMLTY